MKSQIQNLIVVLLIICACNTTIKKDAQKVNFGIYEVLTFNEIPLALIDSLIAKNIKLEKNTNMAVIAYFQKSDSAILHLDFTKENIKLVSTLYPVDNEQKYYALVALKTNPVIDNSNIQKTKYKNTNMEIHFDMEGSRKWAELTKNNIDKKVAFVIDNIAYSLPEIRGEIRSGIAIINGLKDESFARKISESLNNSISK